MLLKNGISSNKNMDINCDLGEGRPDEEKLMALIDSCNIACGGHFGDKQSMKETLMLSKMMGVKAGAHPSFADRENFGRKSVDIPLQELKEQVIGQISELNQIAKSVGVTLHHVKAHGALYNEAARSEEIGNALIDAVVFFKQDLCIFVPYGSKLHELAKDRRIRHWAEVFADRNYNNNLELIPRNQLNSVIHDPAEVKQRVRKMIEDRTVVVEGGNEVSIDFETICVHGDHPKALEFLIEISTLKKNRF